MFDFRYHALSLVAVFLALGIGIVLGASLGDSVVSQANKDVRSSLRGDLLNARNDARTEAQAVANRDRFISASFDRIAGGSLRRKRVALVASGGLPQDVESDVRDAVTKAGGTVDSVSKLDARPDLVDLGTKLGSRWSGFGNADQLRPLTRRFARLLVRGGGAARKLKTAFPDSFSGDFKGADAVVYYRTNDDRDTPAKTFESALIEGLRSTGVPVVGAERSDFERSSVDFFDGHTTASVDNIDQVAGRVSLVYALDCAEGDFGVKETADTLMPDLLIGPSRRCGAVRRRPR